MVSARIYIEGGGEGQLLDTLFRQGWNAFCIVARNPADFPAGDLPVQTPREFLSTHFAE
jgi:hypothetical protein